MKKIISLLCLLAMILPLAACSSSLATEETEADTAVTKSETKTEEKREIVYPDSFAVGYAIIDISGNMPIPIFEDEGVAVKDPLMLTCTAVWDGKTTALLMSADLRGMTRSCFENSAQLIEKQFGIPASNVIINCTHTHSAPSAGGGSDSGVRWLSNYYKKLPVVVENALLDLDEVVGTYTGKSFTESLTFVRRYLLPDGTYKTNPGDRAVVSHETDADPEMRTIRFDRKNKKDILMVNHQTHYVGSIGKGMVSSDFVGPFRTKAEKELDVHFVYHQGAGGNINFFSSIPGERIYYDYVSAAEGYMIATRQALSKEEPIQTGKIRTLSKNVTVTVRKEPEDVVELAKKVMAAPETERGTLAAQYGFESWRHANSTVGRAGKGETDDIPLTAVTFGEIAFCAFPYEMFDTNGKEARDGSPYKTTFICSLANGSYGYIASALAFPHGTYEVNACQYVAGTGEQLSQAMIAMLNECKSAS